MRSRSNLLSFDIKVHSTRYCVLLPQLNSFRNHKLASSQKNSKKALFSSNVQFPFGMQAVLISLNRFRQCQRRAAPLRFGRSQRPPKVGCWLRGRRGRCEGFLSEDHQINVDPRIQPYIEQMEWIFFNSWVILFGTVFFQNV